MKLNLQYSESIASSVSAAVIRNSDAKAWLLEISRWSIDLGELECYVLPKSIHSAEPGGLFVVFKNTAKARQLNLLEPYCCIEQKLYIPIQAEVWPRVTSEELKNILLWDLQVFHPTIGLVGFENKDQINLSNLLDYGESQVKDWSFAHPGLFPRPSFDQIKVKQPTAEELIEFLKEKIQHKPLEDVPMDEKDKSSMLEEIIDKIKIVLFTGFISVAKVIEYVLPEASSGSYNTTGNGNGLLQKLQNWLVKNVEELQKKRNSEIKRLLNLFDENTDEALQYAIPLDSPYLNRGSQTVSERLSRNPLRFNLGKLGGGQAVDTWDVSDHYGTLRSKYLKAAQKQIEQKDFKKAAYVYAHLLGDYHNAANVLEQGNMYREAASLYKDHLKNISAAASCLERGALYMEAIELYKELNQDEKIGDLFTILQQTKSAEYHYEQFIAGKLSHNDYLDASRVIYEKLELPERAKSVLLDGWNSSYQYETCLKNYFDIVLKTKGENASEKIKQVFNNDIARHKKVPFLNVMEYMIKNNSDQSVSDTVQQIAYKVVHDETESGNIQILHNLKKFLPKDQLINSDASRYVSQKRANLKKDTAPKVLHLDQTIKWVRAVLHRNQFLAIGIKNGCRHMVRGNWYGNLEYYSWTNPVKGYTRFTFIHSHNFSNHIIIHSSEGVPVTRKNLPKNKYFNEQLVVYCPVWFHKMNSQAVIREEKSVNRIEINNNELTLHHYTMDGVLTKSISIYFESKEFLPTYLPAEAVLINRDEYYYTFSDKYFVIFSETGAAKEYYLGSVIRLFAASDLFNELYLVISTNKGCFLAKPDRVVLNLQQQVFAEDLIPTIISFVAGDKFVLAEKKNAVLFKIFDERPVMIQQYETHSAIVAVLPCNSRNEFALIEESGRINICEIPE